MDFFVFEDIGEELLREIEGEGSRVVRLPGPKMLPALIFKAYAAFKAGNYDIVHANWNTLNLFTLLPACAAGVRVRISHSHSASDRRDTLRHAAKIALRPFARLFATHFLACSRAAAEFQFGEKLSGSGRVKLLRNAVEFDRFAFNQAARDELRASHGLQSRFVVGHVGRFSSPKNQEFLLRLFPQVVELRPDAALVFVGDGPDMDGCERLAMRLGLEEKVFFLGRRNDANLWYSAFDVLCLSSFYEGLGMALVEAQANGLRCVASDGITREADVTGNVEFVSLDDPAVWAEKIVSRRRVDAAGLPALREAIAASGYDMAREAGALTALYERLSEAEHDG